MKKVISSLLLTLLLVAPLSAAHTFMGLSCEVRYHKIISYEGPDYIEFVFRYKGPGYALLYNRVTDPVFTKPQGWAERYTLHVYDGPEYSHEVEKNDSEVIRFNLQEIYDTLTCGEVIIPISLQIDPKIDGVKFEWTLSDTLEFTVAQPDSEGARTFVLRQMEKIKKEKNWMTKEKMYNEIFFIHADVPEVLDACHSFFEDSMMGYTCNIICRSRFAGLSIKYGKTYDLFQYLLYRGGINDEIIFERMKETRVSFTEQQWMTLMDYGSLWTKYYSLKHCRDVDDRNEELYKERLRDLKEGLDYLQKLANDMR
ncbi:MAG TPA: hypothetical protein VI112_09080 [Bacteroidia bacterium]